MNVLITTVPFGEKNRLPVEMLHDNNIKFVINSLGKKLTEDELIGMISDVDVLIAGTEPITERVFEQAKRLKMISRVGIGLDSVDLLAAEKRGIIVSYTPDAPAPAVAELTMGLMLSLLRSIHLSNMEMHSGGWYRHFGRRIPDVTIGVIGVGRIGTRVLNRISSFGSPRLLLNDIKPNDIDKTYKAEWVTKETLYREADVITLHLPYTVKTKDMIREPQLRMMKSDALLINTSRGGIINESDLYRVMKDGHLEGAAIDVFEREPYEGPLAEISRCILTSHMGSMSTDCRSRMEKEATEEAIRFIRNEPLLRVVPKEEYESRRSGL